MLLKLSKHDETNLPTHTGDESPGHPSKLALKFQPPKLLPKENYRDNQLLAKCQ